MYHQVLILRDQLAHDRRWSEEFWRMALVAEEMYNFWKNFGEEYLATCFDNARNGHLETAIFYESCAFQNEEDLALLEKSM